MVQYCGHTVRFLTWGAFLDFGAVAAVFAIRTFRREMTPARINVGIVRCQIGDLIGFQKRIAVFERIGELRYAAWDALKVIGYWDHPGRVRVRSSGRDRSRGDRDSGTLDSVTDRLEGFIAPEQ